MLRVSISALILTLGVAACGPTEQKPDAEPTPSKAETPAAEVPDALPAADPADIPASWAGEALATGMRSTPFVKATPGEGGVVLTGISDKKAIPGGRTSGAFVEYELPATSDLGGLSLKVIVVARSVSGVDSPFSVAYSTAKKGNSGWNEFVATPEFASYSFTYKIKPNSPKFFDNGPDYIGTLVSGDSSIIVESVAIELAEPESSGE